MLYRRLASIAVPDRADQIATLLCLIPFGRDEEFRVVELGSGEGRRVWSVLKAFPRAHVNALDGSESMREETRARTEGFAGRVKVTARKGSKRRPVSPNKLIMASFGSLHAVRSK